MYCGHCKKELSPDTRNVFPPDAIRFCSKKCLKEHIQGMSWTVDLTQNNLLRRSAKDFGDRNCFSVKLGTGFRSWFECMVAEDIVTKWEVSVEYEPHQLVIDRTHAYVPDFWLPEYGVWLEVKGEWRNGGKKKFQRALEMLGPDRLLLIPQPYKNWFKPRKRSS